MGVSFGFGSDRGAGGESGLLDAAGAGVGATITGGGAIGVGAVFVTELSITDFTDTDGCIVSSSAEDAAGAGPGIAGFGTSAAGASGGCVGAGAEAGGGSLFVVVVVSGNILRITVVMLAGFVSASGGGGGGIGTGGFRAGERVVDEGTSGLVVAEVEDEDEGEEGAGEEGVVDRDGEVSFEVELVVGDAG